MIPTTTAIKIEDDTSTNAETKSDVAEAKAEPKAVVTEESANGSIKTDTSETTDATTADDEPTKSEDSIADSIFADAEVENEIETLSATDASKKETIDDNDAETQLENDSDDDTSSSDEDKTEVKSEGTSNNWDNGYSSELQKLYSKVDADTRAVAEEMIRAVHAGNKKKVPTIEDKPESPSPTLNHAAHDPTPAIAPRPAATKSVAPDVAAQSEPKKINCTLINKGNEPSALELALKQQGITHSDQLRSTQFPFRLHNMLDDAERSGHAHILSWCPGGDSFKIHKPTKLINVLQKYFRQSKFKSFLRQLQGYNFKRITRGKDQGVVSHPLFLRGRRSVSTLMRRKRVGPKVIDSDKAQASRLAVAAGAFAKKAGIAVLAPNQKSNTRILPHAQHPIAHPNASSIHSAQAFLNNGVQKLSSQTNGTINPNPQDVLCVDYPNGQQVQQFQGNRKLASIVQKITGHYTSANESVKTMIVNEISSRIQNSGSRFLKLSKDGLSWMECNREEMFRKVISSFELEIGPKEYKDKTHIDLTEDSDSSTSSIPTAATNKSSLPGLAERNLHAVGTSSDPGRRLLPRNQDVVMRGGPGSEREGNTYLKTMIQVNVGQQQDSFEMKRIKCRAILERMKRRGSRFFLKLKETDSDDEMYVLSDMEAQEVIYTAFCAEEKKMQSLFVEAKALAGRDGNGNHPGLSGLVGAAQFASMAGLQGDAAMLSQLKANNEMNLLASQQASLKRPLPGHGHHSHENIIEKRLRAETDEHIKILIERERQRRSDPYSAAGRAGRLPFNARNTAMESSMPMPAAFGGAGATSHGIDQYLKERRADEMLLNSATAARTTFSAGPSPSGLAAELPKSNNHFVEFLKKKYVKSAQERAW